MNDCTSAGNLGNDTQETSMKMKMYVIKQEPPLPYPNIAGLAYDVLSMAPMPSWLAEQISTGLNLVEITITPVDTTSELPKLQPVQG